MLRSPRERLLQTVTTEAGGVVVTAPLYVILFGERGGQGGGQSPVMMVVLSLAVIGWATIYNSLFD